MQLKQKPEALLGFATSYAPKHEYHPAPARRSSPYPFNTIAGPANYDGNSCSADGIAWQQNTSTSNAFMPFSHLRIPHHGATYTLPTETSPKSRSSITGREVNGGPGLLRTLIRCRWCPAPFSDPGGRINEDTKCCRPYKTARVSFSRVGRPLLLCLATTLSGQRARPWRPPRWRSSLCIPR